MPKANKCLFLKVDMKTETVHTFSYFEYRSKI